MAKKMQRKYVIEEEAAAALVRLAGSPRKQGEYLSRLIRKAASGEDDTIEMLREQIRDVLEQQSKLRVLLSRAGIETEENQA